MADPFLQEKALDAAFNEVEHFNSYIAVNLFRCHNVTTNLYVTIFYIQWILSIKFPRLVIDVLTNYPARIVRSILIPCPGRHRHSLFLVSPHRHKSYK